MVERVAASILGLQVILLFLNFNNLMLNGNLAHLGLKWPIMVIVIFTLMVLVYILVGYFRLLRNYKN
ncbi:hypothetical protein [Streptococcus sp. 20-1249]|uniref:hypothetical protein n=1 Tax=Streptococcus hepaticus TaxID=3349163 RepID=UPI001C97E008